MPGSRVQLPLCFEQKTLHLLDSGDFLFFLYILLFHLCIVLLYKCLYCVQVLTQLGMCNVLLCNSVLGNLFWLVASFYLHKFLVTPVPGHRLFIGDHH